MRKGRVPPQSEVIKAILSGYSPCCGGLGGGSAPCSGRPRPRARPASRTASAVGTTAGLLQPATRQHGNMAEPDAHSSAPNAEAVPCLQCHSQCHSHNVIHERQCRMTGTENLAGPFCHGSAAVAVADFQIRGGQQRLSGLQGGARSNNASLQRQAMLHHQKERHQSLAATAAEVQGKASVFGSNGSRSAGKERQCCLRAHLGELQRPWADSLVEEGGCDELRERHQLVGHWLALQCRKQRQCLSHERQCKGQGKGSVLATARLEHTRHCDRTAQRHTLRLALPALSLVPTAAVSSQRGKLSGRSTSIPTRELSRDECTVPC